MLVQLRDVSIYIDFLARTGLTPLSDILTSKHSAAECDTNYCEMNLRNRRASVIGSIINSNIVMRPDSPRDFGAIQIIYLLTYLQLLVASQSLDIIIDRLENDVPVHMALRRRVDLCVGRTPGREWKRRPGRPLDRSNSAGLKHLTGVSVPQLTRKHRHLK